MTTTSFLDYSGLNTVWGRIHEVFTTKNGEGANGTWDINISGNANTANAANTLNPSDELNLHGDTIINMSTENGNGHITFNAKEIIPLYTSNQTYKVDLGTNDNYWNNIVTASLHSKNNIYADGTVYIKNASVSTSDERYKNFIEDISIDFNELKKIPKKKFKWKAGEFYDNDKVYLGTSAQAIRNIYPELVHVYKDTKFEENCNSNKPSQDINLESNILGVDYEKLSLVALAAIDKLNDRLESLEKEVKLLKEEKYIIADKLVIAQNKCIELEEQLIDINYLLNKNIINVQKQ